MNVLLMLAVLLAPGEPVPEEARSIYYRALKDAREGRIEKAREGYQGILDNHPKDPFADDALMELARIAEELQGKPARALEHYRRLLSEYPDSRLVRRARARSEFIAQHLDQGEAVLAAYQAILDKSPTQPPLKAVSLMEDLLEKNPEFSLKPDGLYWIGSVLARERLAEQAAQRWNWLVELHPSHPAAGQALVGLVNLAMHAGDLELAQRHIERLAKMPEERWHKASADSAGKLERLRWFRWVFLGSLAIWMAVLLVLGTGLVLVLGSGRLSPRLLVRPPMEFLVFLLLLAGLVIWAATGTRQTTRALLWLSGLVGLLLLSNGFLLKGWVPRGWKLPAWLLMLLAGCFAALVVAIGLSGMTNQVLHTLKWGPS